MPRTPPITSRSRCATCRPGPRCGTHAGITAHPRGPHAPEIWILGSSDYGAQLAAHFGLPYAFAYFFTDGQGAEQALALYRRLYQPSERHPQPQATLCIWALAADSDEEAAHLALSRDRWRIDRGRGVLGPLQSPDAIAARGFDAAELASCADARARPSSARRRSRRADPPLAERFELDEVVVNTWAHDPAVRRRSYALIAAEFGLTASQPRPAVGETAPDVLERPVAEAREPRALSGSCTAKNRPTASSVSAAGPARPHQPSPQP